MKMKVGCVDWRANTEHLMKGEDVNNSNPRFFTDLKLLCSSLAFWIGLLKMVVIYGYN